MFSTAAAIDGAVWLRNEERMPDSLLTANDREEELSRAYVQAVAAMAGYMTAEFKPDRDGTDMQIRAAGSMRPSLDIRSTSS